MKYNLGLDQKNNAQDADDDDYSSLAKKDLSDSRSGGITKEDLDALHRHEGVNMWTSLFMNLVGAGKGIKPGTGQEPLNASLDAHRKDLDLKQKLSNNQADRAAQEQKMGLTGFNLGEAQRESGLAQSPASKIQKATAYSVGQKYGIPFGEKDLNNLTQESFKSNFEPIIQAANLGLKDEQIRSMLQRSQDRGLKLIKDPITGDYKVSNIYDAPTSPVSSTTSGPASPPKIGTKVTSSAASQYPNETENNEYDYSNIHGNIPNLNPADIKHVDIGLQPIKKEAQKLAQEESEFNLSKNNLKSFINEAVHNNNYVASRDLPAQEAKIFEGLKGRLTNMQIQMNKNGEQSGIANQIGGFLGSIAGEGGTTQEDAKNMIQLMDTIDQNTKQHFNSQRSRLKNTAKGLTNKANINYDKELFGSVPENEGVQGSQQSTAPATQSFEDYFSKRGK